jgi:tetratricopeptide (TPR) repeat protein
MGTRSRAAPPLCTFLALSVATALGPRPALAEPTAPQAEAADEGTPAGYAEAIDEGLAEYARGNYVEARVHFQQAHELAPSARTLRALGNADFELRNYGDAVLHLDAALRSDMRPLDAPLRAATERLLERARAYVGEVHVQLDPDSATVSVDGVLVARGPRAALALMVGEHVLEFAAHGRMPVRRSVHVRAGEKVALEVVLDPASASSATSANLLAGGSAPKHDEISRGRRAAIWAGVGAVVVAVGAGVAIALARRGDGGGMSSTSGVSLAGE